MANNKQFQKVKVFAPKLNKFDLSHERKFSFFMGGLYPVMKQEILPGDRFRVNTSVMMRLAPMIAPVMHRVDVTIHYFFVPNRLVWSEWEDFITGGRLGTAAPVHPYITPDEAVKDTGALAKGTVWDMFNCQTFEDTDPDIVLPMNVSALPFRAYQLIYDEYYRDQNLQAALDISTASGQVTGAELTKILSRRTRCWEKDYFTSALPFAQRGGSVALPFDVDVEYKFPAKLRDNIGPLSGPVEGEVGTGDLNVSADDATLENIESLTSNVTINDLRRSIAIQRFLENNALGGGRYTEQLLVRWGVISDDARLQRPEYLGGGRQPVVMSEVLQTAETGETPQGNMAGHGFSVGSSNAFTRRFKEHGYVIGMMSVMPRTAYQNGVPRDMTRFDKYDYAQPELAGIGEQEVKLHELWYDPTNVGYEANKTFGYQSRYAEYKYMCDSVHGDFRDDYSYWHMGRIFTSEPALNEAFVRADPTQRIFAVTDPTVNKLYCQLYHKVDALRPLPYFSTPSSLR